MIEVIDNFLPEESFRSLIYHVIECQQFPWRYCGYVAGNTEEKLDRYNWYLSNVVYAIDPVHIKPEYDPIDEFLISHIKMDKLLRAKANLYPGTDKVFEHAPHVDYDYPTKGAIISLNTCDGFTRLEDGTKVDSVANRMLFFDSSTPHNSSTTTNAQTRINININYL